MTESMCASGADKPFRFLEFPAELRCMVYERITIDVKHHTFKCPTYNPGYEFRREGAITLVSKTLPVAILGTCRLVYAKARPFLQLEFTSLRDTDRFYITMKSFKFFVFAKALDGLCTITLKRKNMLLHGLPILSPSEFVVNGRSIGRTDYAFQDVDEFTRLLGTLTATGFPNITTIAMRYPESVSQGGKDHSLAILGSRFSLRRDLVALMPGQVRFCDATTLDEEEMEG